MILFLCVVFSIALAAFAGCSTEYDERKAFYEAAGLPSNYAALEAQHAYKKEHGHYADGKDADGKDGDASSVLKQSDERIRKNNQ